jgi:hypothetical protein
VASIKRIASTADRRPAAQRRVAWGVTPTFPNGAGEGRAAPPVTGQGSKSRGLAVGVFVGAAHRLPPSRQARNQGRQPAAPQRAAPTARRFGCTLRIAWVSSGFGRHKAHSLNGRSPPRGPAPRGLGRYSNLPQRRRGGQGRAPGHRARFKEQRLGGGRLCGGCASLAPLAPSAESRASARRASKGRPPARRFGCH